MESRIISNAEIREVSKEAVETFASLTKDTNVTFKINAVRHVVTLQDGTAKISLKSFNLPLGNPPTDAHVQIILDGKSYDITSDYKLLIAAIKTKVADEKKQALISSLKQSCSSTNHKSCIDLYREFPDESEDALRILCESGIDKYCMELFAKFEPRAQTDIAAFLHDSNYSPLIKGVLYSAVSLKVLQKVPGGYLVTPNIPGQFEIFKNAHISTNKKLPISSPFCSWVYFTGEYDYVSVIGAHLTVPAFKLYTNTSYLPRCLAAPVQ